MSLFPVVERLAFRSDIPGEVVASTQPEPQKPLPFTRRHLTADMLTRRTPEANEAAKAQFSKLRSRGMWDPPSEQGTILFPGTDGAAVWGGAAYDPETGALYVNANEWASILTLKDVSSADNLSGGAIYRNYCAGCHGTHREGASADFPSLIDIRDRLTFDQIATKIKNGGGRMPAFAALASDTVKLWLLIDYLRTGAEYPVQRSSNQKVSRSPEYIIDGLPRFVDPQGYPATSTPWGTLNAINLNSGEYVWKIPFGEYLN